MGDEENVINEEDLIQEQMKDTRTAISDKLEKLEQKMVDTTVKAVSDSVGTVLDTTQAVKDTVESVKESVRETVNSVKEFAQSGVENVKEFFDLRRQTERHPWLVLGGAVAAGYCLDRWLFARPSEPARTALPPPSSGQPAKHVAHRNGGHREKKERPALVKSWLAGLVEKFGPELEQVKSVALGVTLSLLRDMVARAVPPAWNEQVNDTFHRVADKMHVEIADLSGQATSRSPSFAPSSQESAVPEFGRTGSPPERRTGRFGGP